MLCARTDASAAAGVVGAGAVGEGLALGGGAIEQRIDNAGIKASVNERAIFDSSLVQGDNETLARRGCKNSQTMKTQRRPPSRLALLDTATTCSDGAASKKPRIASVPAPNVCCCKRRRNGAKHKPS